MAQVKKIVLQDILHIMTHNDLDLYKKIGSRASVNSQMAYLQDQNKYKKGVVFVSKSKENLSNGVGHIITSYETLYEQYDSLTHWTPNTYYGGTYYDFSKRIIKGHTKDNLKQINVIGFDIDTKSIHPYEIFIACTQEGLPRPNLLLETPNGYQAFFILSSPFYISKKDKKALATAERLASNLISSLSKHLPIDSNCNSFGFFRMPNNNNVIYFDDATFNTYSFIQWSKDYDKKLKKVTFQVFRGGAPNDSSLDYTSSDWYVALINTKHIDKGHPASSRNNALLTLALANYASGKSFEDAYNQLDQFNSNLFNPLSFSEFNKTLKSAYSGKYNGPKKQYVDSLLDLWTDGNTTFKGPNGWYKFKKDRNNRVRSHYDEWESDIVDYLMQHTTVENPFLQGSLKSLATELNIPLSSFKEVLKRSKQLVKHVIGTGRAAVTYISTKMLFLRFALRKCKLKLSSIQLAYQDYLKLNDMIITTFELPSTINLDIYKWLQFDSVQAIDLSGLSPPLIV